jgi:predicted nucleic acid-binding protein
MDHIFVDTDIILDMLADRTPHNVDSRNLFSAADRGEIRISVSSLSFTNLHYILSKQDTAQQSRKKLIKFKTLVTILSVDDKIIELALSSDFSDFEDAVQYFTTIENGIKILLTRNLKDYKTAEIPVMTAGEYLKGRK